jgi:hypothetical protein
MIFSTFNGFIGLEVEKNLYNTVTAQGLRGDMAVGIQEPLLPQITLGKLQN